MLQTSQNYSEKHFKFSEILMKFHNIHLKKNYSMLMRIAYVREQFKSTGLVRFTAVHWTKERLRHTQIHASFISFVFIQPWIDLLENFRICIRHRMAQQQFEWIPAEHSIFLYLLQARTTRQYKNTSISVYGWYEKNPENQM